MSAENKIKSDFSFNKVINSAKKLYAILFFNKTHGRCNSL